MTSTDWIAIIGATTGIIGTVLGGISVYDLLNKNRVTLRVTPLLAWVNRSGAALTARVPARPECDPAGGQPPNGLAVEVVNLSIFPVTICEVGFRRTDASLRFFMFRPRLGDGRELPARLEPRQALTAYCDLPCAGREQADFLRACAGVAFAKTQCGSVACGRSPAFAGFLASLSRQETEPRS